MSYVLAELICGDRQNVSMHDVQVVSTFCYKCRSKRAIVDVVTTEWFAYCYDCKFKKYFGNDEDAAKESARRHWRRLNSHRASHGKKTRPKSVEAREFLIKRGIVTSCG